MKSKKVIAALVLVILTSLLLYAGLVPQTVEKTIQTPLPTFRLTEQIASPSNLLKWLIPFSYEGTRPEILTRKDSKMIKLPEDSVQISIRSIFNTDLKLYSGKNDRLFSFRVLPDTVNASLSTVTMSYKTTLLKNWINPGKAVNNALKSFENLKEYLSDTKRLYGYEIRPVTVTDTAFLFLRETVPFSEKRNATRRLFERLISYAEKTNAGYNGIRIFYSLKTDDNITLFASIGVTNRVSIDDKDSIEYKMMPFEKRLIEAVYQGPYGESDKVFKALEQFKSDHNMTSMAIPFQKFLSDGYDFADDQIVQLKVYYPIF